MDLSRAPNFLWTLPRRTRTTDPAGTLLSFERTPGVVPPPPPLGHRWGIVERDNKKEPSPFYSKLFGSRKSESIGLSVARRAAFSLESAFQ